MANRIHIEITGDKQGLFHGDKLKGAPGPSRCHGLKWCAKKSNDHGRAGSLHSSGTASADEPVQIHKPIGPSTPQLWDAYWQGEVLSTVKIVIHYADGTGDTDKPFQILTLTNATISAMEQEVRDLSSESTTNAAGDAAPFVGTERIEFTYEQITVEHPTAKTKTKHGHPSNKLGLPSLPSMPNL